MPSRKVTRIPRGGFAVGRPMSGARLGGAAWKAAGKRSAKKVIKAAKDQVIKYAKRKGADAVQSGAESIRKRFEEEFNRRLSSKTAIDVSFTTEPVGNDSPTNLIPVQVRNSQAKSYLANLSDDRVVHKTKYETGHPAFKETKDAIRQNGGGYRVMEDSMITINTVDERNTITATSGFNSKVYHMPCANAQVSYANIKELIGKFTQPDNSTFDQVRKYSMVAKVKRQFLIKNSSSNFPIDFKIHLVKMKNPGNHPNGMISCMSHTFLNETDYQGISVTPGKAPRYLQHGGFVVEGTGGTNKSTATVRVSNKFTKLTDVSNFREGYELIESFSKTIAPGDFWNFSHVHNCGKGIDFDVIYRAVADHGPGGSGVPPGNNTEYDYIPFTFGIIFEAKGKMVEGYHIPSLGAVSTHLGTAPANFMYEFKSSAYFANDAIGSAPTSDPMVKVETKENALADWRTRNTKKEFFVLPALIASSKLDADNALNIGKLYIPVESSTNSDSNLYPGAVPGRSNASSNAAPIDVWR